MRLLQLYHATRHGDAVRADAVLRVDRAGTASDPGDLGRGIYLTGLRARARAISHDVLVVDLELVNPLVFDSMEAAYRWRDGMCYMLRADTIVGSADERRAAAAKLADYCLRHDVDGLVVNDPVHGTHYEVVAFRDVPITKE